MASNVNGSELLDNPFNTIMGTFTDILGGSFYLIPIGVIAVALYVYSRDVTVSAIWLMASSLLVGTSFFSTYPGISFVYYLFTVFGLVVAIVSIFFIKK